MKRRPPPCDHIAGHGLLRARLYVTGWCCDRHTPAALAGRPEVPPGPGWPSGSYLNTRTEPSRTTRSSP
ncbi:hypothetical protein [Streptomyces nymphaeiformis]|uniref:Uncharacterized protein n=1 Tax=Streptomyces nymphaeiformis TaxID=2663842 RepID=A0A7W7U9K2_9ACTN|nr:hypothetical protein [Streptomyces nymphaeiformis]MBB4987471.1 hypothetical protein [Streptomyces nymphaeiformis]